MLPTPANRTDDNELMAILCPVWINTYWVENYLGLYEGVSKHAGALSDDSHFFGLVQHLSLDAAAIGICKLYDKSNPQFKKHTIPALMTYLEDNFTVSTFVPRLDSSILIDLGITQADTTDLISALRKDDTFCTARTDLIKMLDNLMPARDRCHPLKQLFLYRNKIAAHQEQLTDSLEKQLRYLPSLNDMEKINKWAADFCRLIATVLSLETFLPSPISARTAALNVVAKVLGKHFDPSASGAAYKEYEAFYSNT